ncbi:MAG: GTPase ObgE [Candidatus Saccharimonadales bacterium]
MFVDKVTVKLKAGKGGDGIVSFRHEKFIERGGPDGGDGGDGGDIIARASNNQNTLAKYRYRKEVSAGLGKNGSKRKKHGRSGKDLVINLPVGTVISVNDKILADLTENNQEVLIAKGGKGGFGNAHFTSSTRQAPRIRELGEPGEEFEAVLELKIIADVGLIGLPNAGKSTFLSITSNARPEIADYPFTTLQPNLGVVDIDENTSVLFADIPGLIEGASKGKGLGDEFLRHVERTKLLIHIIDAYHEDIGAAYKTIINELKHYSVDLAKRPQIVAINKIDGLDEDIVAEQLAILKKTAKRGTKIFPISAQSNQGTKELLYETKNRLAKIVQTKAEAAKEKIPVIRLPKDNDSWQVQKTRQAFVVSGVKIERFARRTNFEDEEGVNRLKDIMHKTGILKELERKGIKPGGKIKISDIAELKF